MIVPWQYLSSSLLYLALVFTIGIWSRRKSKNFEPHLGGRSMNFWTTALSAHASDMSAWLFLSLPMLIWLHGGGQMWIAIGLWLGMAFNWLFVAKRLRDKTAAAGCVTLPAWLHHAFADKYGYVRLLCSVISSLFLLHYLAAGLIAMGLLMNQLFGLNYTFGTLLAMLVITAYTMKGGFNAVAWVDLFQALFLLAAIVAVPFVGWFKIDGLLSIEEGAFNKQILLSPFFITGDDQAMQAVVTALGWGLGYFGMPHILSKFMGIGSSSELKKSMIVGLTWQAVALAASIGVGLVGLGMVSLKPTNPELLFINMVEMLFHPAAAGLIFCAIMAANLSTMDSQLLVTASVVVEDLIKPYFKLRTSHSIKAFRIATFSLALLAWCIASSRSPSVQDAVMYSWSGLGAAYGPLILWSLYVKRTHWICACLSLISSCGTVMIWPCMQGYINDAISKQLVWPALLPGFMVGIGVLAIAEVILILKNRIQSANYSRDM